MDPTFDSTLGLQSNKITTPHIMLTRAQGVSPSPYSSLNLSFGVGDAPENVRKNRRKIKELPGIRFLVSSRQIHAARIYSADNITGDIEVEGYDALVTDQPGIGLLIQQADCQAILLHDPVRRAIAAIHCGWRGNVANIISATIARLHRNYRSDPAVLQAVISPSLGPCCGEFVHFQTRLPSQFHQFQAAPDHFDFRAISRWQLIRAGVPEGNIDIMPICTVCNTDFFSYRRARKRGNASTGRQGSAIWLAS